MNIRAAVTRAPGALFAIEELELERPRTAEAAEDAEQGVVVKPVLRMPI